MALSLPPTHQNKIVTWLEQLDYGVPIEEENEPETPTPSKKRSVLEMTESLPSISSIAISMDSPGPSKYKELSCQSE